VAATRTLSEADSAALVSRYGVPMIESRRARTPHEAVEAARALGENVAVKLNGARITHKTERQLVRLGCTGDDEVRDAAAALLETATESDGEVDLLVARMASGSRELVAGVVVDPQYGPCVMVGLGGVLAEAVDDVALRLAPIARADAADMIDDLRHQGVLASVRGEPAVDRDALADVLLALSRLANAETSVRSVDVNPLVVEGGLPIGVDALVETWA
jgi:acetyl-CoA synthetase (ADP-forming)